MNLLNDVITYIRRIIKSPSDSEITDNLIIDYINRFWIMDVDARIQLFDLKTKYAFQTIPGIDQYNMPLYDIQTEPGGQPIASMPVYQGFLGPAYVNGVEISFETQKHSFFRAFPNVVQYLEQVEIGNGGANYTFRLPILANQNPLNPPIQGILRGHVDITGIIATGNNQDPIQATTINPLIPSTSILPSVYITVTNTDGSNIVVTDSGQFLLGNLNYGLLMTPGTAPFGYSALNGGYSTTLNTINYLTGEINVTFPDSVPVGANINVQCYYFETGLPRSCLFYNNVLTLRMPPAKQYLVELDCYLTPAAFLNTGSALPFGYMAEYIARGAARKILSDTGDTEQFQFYEPLFREQEILVWKRSQRIFTATRTKTIYMQDDNLGSYGGYNNMGAGNL